MTTSTRSILKAYEGDRVYVSGYYSKSSCLYPAHKKVTCIEDCEVTSTDGKNHYFDTSGYSDPTQ